VAVGVGVLVSVGVLDGLGVAVRVGVGVTVGVDVDDGVGVGDAGPATSIIAPTHSRDASPQSTSFGPARMEEVTPQVSGDTPVLPAASKDRIASTSVPVTGWSLALIVAQTIFAGDGVAFGALAASLLRLQSHDWGPANPA
jgi:hypothetical protein